MTGNIAQVFDTASSSYKEREPLIGALRYKLNTHSTKKKRTYKIFCRKIDAVAAFENLAATAESRQDLVSKPLTNFTKSLPLAIPLALLMQIILGSPFRLGRSGLNPFQILFSGAFVAILILRSRPHRHRCGRLYRHPL